MGCDQGYEVCPGATILGLRSEWRDRWQEYGVEGLVDHRIGRVSGRRAEKEQRVQGYRPPDRGQMAVLAYFTAYSNKAMPVFG